MKVIEVLTFASVPITTVTIPDSVTDIYFGAFNGTSLTGTLTIPSSVIHIASSAFSSTNLSTVYLSSNTGYDSNSLFLSFDKTTNVIVR